MATAISPTHNHFESHALRTDSDDPFLDNESPSIAAKPRPRPPPAHFDHATSASDARRMLESQIQENERRLQDAQKLGTSLLKQQDSLQARLEDLQHREDDAEITPELRQQLAQLEREHEDVGREISRALMPKSRAVSAEEAPQPESSVYSSQATASPTKVTAPSRRQRNQPSSRAGDLQFAADISTSLLAQVRQLQSAVAERDEMIKENQIDRNRIELDTAGLTQRLRTLDENEQRYKDENWNLETQNHQLNTAVREASDKEKRLAAALAGATMSKSQIQSEVEEIRAAHDKLTEEHVAARKAHDTEVHGLKRVIDSGDGEKNLLQARVDELTSQNQELARAITDKFRAFQAPAGTSEDVNEDDEDRDLDALDDSPPPSPTKATPRHPGLESETLRSSLHHAHRMIQNLKNNIHREKTEKLELKRMLQDARDDLEQQRGGPNSGTKRLKTKGDNRKGVKPDMLGGSRRLRTDVELDDEAWEDHEVSTPTHGRRHLSVPGAFSQSGLTDTSDAYATATEAEATFETADEKHATTESEDFATGAESLAGDSTDDLTETEDNVSRGQRTGTIRGKPALALAMKPAGDRRSWMSTASTSAGEEAEDLKTPVPTQAKFRLKNGRGPAPGSRQFNDSTPNSFRALSVIQGSSPATAINDQSPGMPEQSLFDQLGEMDEMSSNGFGTPGGQSIASAKSTPHSSATPSRRITSVQKLPPVPAVVMIDAAVMTEPWAPEPISALDVAADYNEAGQPTANDFPLPPSVPVSPIHKTDMSTQYTPQRFVQESPSRNANNFITPPKTVWDEASEAGMASPEVGLQAPITPKPQLGFSGVLTQNTTPKSPSDRQAGAESTLPASKAFSGITALQTEPVSPQAPSQVIKAPVSLDSTARSEDRPKTAEKAVGVAAGAGLMASAAAAFGLSRKKSKDAPVIAEDHTSEPEVASNTATTQGPLNDISHNAVAGRLPEARKSTERPSLVTRPSNDQGSQTMLTAEQIDQALRSKPAYDANVTPVIAMPSPVRRPGSAGSNRTSSLVRQDHPPLPPNHKAAIAQARVSSPPPPPVLSPTREGNAQQPGTVMGPPMMPASAMRRPRTQDGSVRSPTRDSNMSRGSYSQGHSRVNTTLSQNTQISRRSSVSSFASELDERFNIRQGEQNTPHGFEASPGTDPRMIQAITQTMIGEFLWKYTRKAGRSDFSDTRHRRYFWVHPYTKTLYWSDQDPQTAGRNELKAKSVAIEAVRVISDDNPMPPGLHRKTLEITTPGRKVRFTASTGQRHETWFNALSYLLLRSDQGDTANVVAAGYPTAANEITPDDVREFNVAANGYSARLIPNGSRASMSSYNSRTTRGTSANRGSVRHSAPLSGVMSTSNRSTMQPTQNADRTSRAEQPREADKVQTARASSVNRFSRVVGSITGRTSRSMNRTSDMRGESNSIYDASVVSDNRKDSAEQLRQEMLREEEGLENVRSCCDGKL